MFGNPAQPNPMFNPGAASPFGMGQDPMQMMNNPMFAQMMSQMLSNPQMLDSMISSNPQIASMITPEMRQQMQSPEFRAMMSNPQALQQIIQMQQMMGGFGGMGGMGAGMNPLNNMYGQPPTSGFVNPYADTPAQTATPPVNPFFNPAMMQQMMGAANPATSTQPQQPPEELYQTQLAQLQEMGFFNPQENIRALQMTGGNVEAAVEWLFSRPPGQL
jgi:ubiquilin